MSSELSVPTVTLKELFEKQPSTLTEDERKAVIAHLRAARENYTEARQTARKTGKRIKKNAGISMESVGLLNSSIDELLDEFFPEDKTEIKSLNGDS